MDTHSVRRSAGLALLAWCMAVAGCAGKESSPAQTQNQPSAVSALAKMGHLATDPIAQMSFAFEGNPPPEEIRERIDKVLGMYSLEVNDENRRHAGRTLVALRKEHGHSEMEILEKMLNTPATGKQFEEAAGRISAGMNQ
ncbi:MAG: hypothetical protein DMG13_03445 [Acidobacteria bacterium]|nr:MAG: hypothetical protein DMG13_03445 [Acidobacteriota bacterium]